MRCNARYNTKEMVSEEWNYRILYKDVIKILKTIVNETRAEDIR